MADVLSFSGETTTEKMEAKELLTHIALLAEEYDMDTVLILALNEKGEMAIVTNSEDKYETFYMASKFQAIALEDDHA